MSRTHSVSLVALSGAGATLVLGTFLPWLRSGTMTRSSYDLLGLIGRLDVAPNGAAAALIRWCTPLMSIRQPPALIRWWPLVPLLVTGAVILAWWERFRWALAIAVLVTLYAGGVAAVLVVGAAKTGITIGIGPWVCSVASLVFMAAAVSAPFTASMRRAG